MHIQYASRKLEKSVSTPSQIKANYGTMAKLVSQRLEELATISNLDVIRYLPQANCHELTGPLKGKLAVDISGNHRIIFEPHHNPIPRKADGGLDWKAVTIILIVAIGKDYH